jgi:hypothetical protein
MNLAGVSIHFVAGFHELSTGPLNNNNLGSDHVQCL